MIWLSIITAYLFSMIIYQTSILLMAMACKLKIETLSLFVGPTLFEFSIRLITCEVKLIPLGAAVKLSEEGFQQAERWKKLCLYLSGIAMLLFAAVCLIGWNQFASIFVTAYWVFPYSLIASLEFCMTAVLFCLGQLASHSFLWQIGAISAVNASINLLPLPFLNGGQFLLEISKMFTHKRLEDLTAFLVVSVVLYFIIILKWILAAYLMLAG